MKRLLLTSLAVLCAVQTLCGDEPREPYRGPVVVLKSGTVLRGRGTNLGEKIAVELVDGGEMKLAKDKVDVIADSLDDAYLQRREKLLPDNVLSQLNLAYWCLEQDMKTEARLHLKEAKKIDSSHPGISRLQRKIAEHTRAREEEQSDKPVEAPPAEDLKDLLKKRMEAARMSSRAESGEVSPATKVRFNKDVLPILLGSCAASKCHGPNSPNEFRLVRSSAHSDNHMVLVKRNLQTVVSRLDLEAPDESPLLEMAVTAHASGVKSPALGISSREFSVLVDWVIAATDDLNRPKGGAVAYSPPALSKPPATMPSSGAPSANRSLEDDPSDLRDSNARPVGEEPRVAEKSTRPSAKKNGAAKPGAKRKEEDAPGDPSEFNQKFFPDGPK